MPSSCSLCLRSPKLRVTSALKVIAMVEAGECFVTVEGVPEPAEIHAEMGTADAAELGDDDGIALGQLHHHAPPPAGAYCATFTNEINLLDLVADVQEIYRSFTANVSTSQTATPIVGAGSP